jgi:hypothetical protein
MIMTITVTAAIKAPAFPISKATLSSLVASTDLPLDCVSREATSDVRKRKSS